MSRPKLQASQAALSFTEKIKVLEKLRDRDRAIAAAGLRVKAGADTKKDENRRPGNTTS